MVSSDSYVLRESQREPGRVDCHLPTGGCQIAIRNGGPLGALAVTDSGGLYDEKPVHLTTPVVVTSDLVVGTGSDAPITFSVPASDDVKVSINEVKARTFNGDQKRMIDSLGGNDDVRVADSIGLPSWLYRGAGDDLLKGDPDNGVIDGGTSNDRLFPSDDHNTAHHRCGALPGSPPGDRR